MHGTIPPLPPIHLYLRFAAAWTGQVSGSQERSQRAGAIFPVCFAAAGLLPATHRCLINKHTLRGDICVHKAGNTNELSAFTASYKTGSAAEGRNKHRHSVFQVSERGHVARMGDMTNYFVKVCDNGWLCWMFPSIWDVLAIGSVSGTKM
jgi:hypothetical protein